MITLLIGENSFEISRALKTLAAGFDGQVERIDGEELELRQLPDLLMGATLFADKRLVIMKRLSENKAVWADFGDWLPRVSDDVHLVLVEPKPDKRTKTYKQLQKAARAQDFPAWSERDTGRAEKWAVAEAGALGFTLAPASARTLVARVGADQWLLAQALEKLAFVDEPTPQRIEEIIEATPVENVFNLFEAALRGDTAKVSEMLQTLELTEDPFRLFGLLSGQVFQLSALAIADKPDADVAKDIGAHPFALSKLAPHARRLGRGGARRIISAFAEADEGMKTSAASPWLLIERALIKTAQVR